MTDDLSAEERVWADSAGKALRESENSLDAVTLMRLRAARARAVDAATPRALPQRWGWALPAAVAAGLFAVVVVPQLMLTRGPAVNVAEAETLDVLTDEMDPEFYENLDLYLWLEESSDSA